MFKEVFKFEGVDCYAFDIYIQRFEKLPPLFYF